MAEEPENLGDRLRRLERDVAALQSREEENRAGAAMLDELVEHVLMPAILLLSGQGHRDQLVDMFQRAIEHYDERQRLAEPHRSVALDLLQGWQHWLLRQPEWELPLFAERHPDLHP